VREEYTQLELDTRPDLERAIIKVTDDAIQTAREMIAEYQQNKARQAMTEPPFVRNRHEAYGIAAEQYSKIGKAVNSIKGDTSALLATLSDPNLPALEATSSICNSTSQAAYTLIMAAAEMKRTLDNLYTAELDAPEHTPIDDLVAEGEFQEADPVDAEEASGDESADDE